MINTTLKQLWNNAFEKHVSVDIDSKSYDRNFTVWMFNHKIQWELQSHYMVAKNVTPDLLEETVLWMLVRM